MQWILACASRRRRESTLAWAWQYCESQLTPMKQTTFTPHPSYQKWVSACPEPAEGSYLVSMSLQPKSKNGYPYSRVRRCNESTLAWAWQWCESQLTPMKQTAFTPHPSYQKWGTSYLVSITRQPKHGYPHPRVWRGYLAATYLANTPVIPEMRFSLSWACRRELSGIHRSPTKTTNNTHKKRGNQSPVLNTCITNPSKSQRVTHHPILNNPTKYQYSLSVCFYAFSYHYPLAPPLAYLARLAQ